MKALVTGGSGFLGGWIVKFLLQRGDSVRILGRREYPELEKQNVEIMHADITNRAKVEEACKGINTVFHIAAHVGIWGRRKDFYRTNVTGTENVISGCLKHGIKRLIYTSSSSVVYGKAPIENGNEDLPYPKKFIAVYPETKAIAEKKVIEANGKGGLLTCSLRPHLIWGPGDTNLIPRLVKFSRENKLTQVGDGTNMISTIYVENAADAHLRACDRLVNGSSVAGQSYFLVEPKPINCWEFLNRILSGLACPVVTRKVSIKKAYITGAAFEVVYKLLNIWKEPPMTRFLALQLGTSHSLNPSRIMRDLEWNSKIDIEEGLERLLRDFRNKL